MYDVQLIVCGQRKDKKQNNRPTGLNDSSTKLRSKISKHHIPSRTPPHFFFSISFVFSLFVDARTRVHSFLRSSRNSKWLQNEDEWNKKKCENYFALLEWLMLMLKKNGVRTLPSLKYWQKIWGSFRQFLVYERYFPSLFDL